MARAGHARPLRAQALVEFAVVASVFMLAMFSMVAIGLREYETQAAVTAVSAGLQAASSALAGVNETDPNLVRPALAAGYAPTQAILANSLFGTNVVAQPAGTACPTDQAAINQIPDGEVHLCIWQDPRQTDPDGQLSLVAEALVGRPASLVPLSPFMPYTMRVVMEVHKVTFV